MHKRLGLSTLAALALTAAMTARGEVAPGFYVGAGFGTTEVSEDSIDEFIADDSDTGLKAFGGYNFNEYFAIEASYFDFGEASGTIEDPDFGDIDFSTGVTGMSAAAVGRLPVAGMFAVFGKVGFASYDVEFDVTLPGFGSGSQSASETDMIYGVGGALSFADRFEARVEYEVLNVENGDVNMICVTGLYRF
jgi:OmpA-OmpF porin, OOP family